MVKSAEIKKHPCIKCDGSGKKSILLRTSSGDHRLEVDCLYCDGLGWVQRTVAEQHAMQAAAEAIWCRCPDSPGSNYVPDAPGSKHHWCCDDCGKVTQIG